MKAACKARRMNDEMQCECGLTWDMKDDDPPACPQEAPAVFTNDSVLVREVRHILRGIDECGGTWWDNEMGAEFGASTLAAVIDAIEKAERL